MPAILLIAFGIAARFLPHPANFTPIGAIAIFGGLYLPKKLSVWLPLSAMLISDIFIGFYSLPIMASVYVGFMFANLLSLTARGKLAYTKTAFGRFGTIAGATALSSAIFYLLTNAAVWAFGSMYPHNFTGLLESYYLALPFFRNSLAGDVFFTFVLVGGMELLKHTLRDSSALRRLANRSE